LIYWPHCPSSASWPPPCAAPIILVVDNLGNRHRGLKKIRQLADHWQSGLRIGSWILRPYDNTTTTTPMRAAADGLTGPARLGRELTSFPAPH
jgi:hypothetical protein